MQIADNTVVHIDYTLKLDSGEVVDSSEGQEPLAYLHGVGQIVPGLEKELTGLKVGDKKDVVVTAEEGYGDRDADGVFGIPKSAFPDTAQLEVGASFIGEDDEGHAMPVRIVKVEGDNIVVDANHPLAGERLHFSVEVKAIREATAEELEHGHPHEGDGHHHH